MTAIPRSSTSKRIAAATWSACFAGPLLALLSGCQSVPKTVSNPPAGGYHDVRLSYDLSGQYRDIPLERPAVTLTSLESPGDESPGFGKGALERWTSARLLIQYPHPEARPEMARATLRLSGHLCTPRARKGTDAATYPAIELPELFASHDGEDFALPSARDDEVWILDFPRQQLDLLMADLRKAGFFESQLRTDPGTRLEIDIDHKKTAKAWTPEPRLDDFVARVHKEGRLSGFVSRPEAAVGSSVAARGN